MMRQVPCLAQVIFGSKSSELAISKASSGSAERIRMKSSTQIQKDSVVSRDLLSDYGNLACRP